TPATLAAASASREGPASSVARAASSSASSGPASGGVLREGRRTTAMIPHMALEGTGCPSKGGRPLVFEGGQAPLRATPRDSPAASGASNGGLATLGCRCRRF